MSINVWQSPNTWVPENINNFSGSAQLNIGTILVNLGVKSFNAATIITAITTNIVKGNKNAQTISDLFTTTNLISTGDKLSFSVIQNSVNATINIPGTKGTNGTVIINTITSYSISGTAAELIIKSGIASLSAENSINYLGLKGALSNVAITESTNINVARYKHAIASASFNNQLTALAEHGTKKLFSSNSISSTTTVIAFGINRSFVYISRKIVIQGKVSSGVIIKGII